MNMDFERKLTIPMELKEKYPLTKEMETIVKSRDNELKSILSGKEQKLILIIGPCSADNEKSVLDYILRLKKVQETVKDKIFIIPRLYTNKPRTTGEGYKGLVHQPNPHEKPDMFNGIVSTRALHMKVLSETGFSCADEMLYPENFKYIDDLVGYVTVGARSVEDQQHRLTASGVNVPIGMKNPTSGDFSIMLNAISTAQHKHTFIYRGWEAHSHGNEFAHAIIRGYQNKHGEMLPNYHYEDLELLYSMYKEKELQNPAVIVDANHANSKKNPLEQTRIVKEVLQSCKYNKDIASIIKGFMIESYIEEGCQDITDEIYGKSITDACLGWHDTEELILEIAGL